MAETKLCGQESAKGVQAKGPNPRLTGKLCEHMTYAAREAFKRLRTGILMAFPEEEGDRCKVIGITSAQSSEGKSTVSVNLAYSLAELGKSVLLLDGDMRRPSLHDKMGLRMEPGLSDLLTNEDQIGSVVIPYKNSDGITMFNMIPSGTIPNNPSELLNGKRFESMIKILSSACDYIIIDLPPLDLVVDAVTVSKLTDGMIMVVRENNCPRYLLDDCLEQLNYAKANVLGVVVNGSVEGAGKRYQYRNQPYRYGK